jgi:hypothetical protein
MKNQFCLNWRLDGAHSRRISEHETFTDAIRAACEAFRAGKPEWCGQTAHCVEIYGLSEGTYTIKGEKDCNEYMQEHGG